MTYCVAIKVNNGLVFASDSRTNAGVDYVSTYSKMFVFTPTEDRMFVLMTSGNLATSQAVVNIINRDLENPKAKLNLAKVPRLFEAAEYVGDISVAVQARHGEMMEKKNVSAESNFILGGQIADQAHDVFHVYPQGNSISASPETPYLQIGETKYGKPILDRVIAANTTLEDASRCALVSLDSTMRSNISVGPPIDLAIYEKGKHELSHYLNLKLGSPMYSSLQKRWNDGLRRAFTRLPRFDWEQASKD